MFIFFVRSILFIIVFHEDELVVNGSPVRAYATKVIFNFQLQGLILTDPLSFGKINRLDGWWIKIDH